MNSSQDKLKEAIAGLFPDQVKVYDVSSTEINYKNNSLLHQHFQEPLSSEGGIQLAREIAVFLQDQGEDAVYSYFHRSPVSAHVEAEWRLSSARLQKSADGLPKEVVVFTYNLQLLGDSRKRLYRVLENDDFFRANLSKVSSLTKREKEIIECLVSGMTSSEIASKLYISAHTVNSHRKHIHTKLATETPAGLYKYADIFELACKTQTP
ncbi:MAG TPA: LuxR C-terminal-related transcriptional regulator [Hanamia sp.]